MAQTQQFCMLLFASVLFFITCDAFTGARIDLGRKVAASSSATGANVTAPAHASSYEYLLEVSVGTPPVSYYGIADTGSDLIWLACQPCKYCTDQVTAEYDPTKSSTYSAIPCDSSLCDALLEDDIQVSCSKGNGCSYYAAYGSSNNSGEWTTGTLGNETFTFGSSRPVALPSISFGCSNDSGGGYSNASGLVGLGRGSLSLVSQLGAKKFSYCLTSYGDTHSTSPLFLGSSANLTGTSVQSTRFVANPSNFTTFYYLSLKGISVGATPLPIPPTVFELNPDGTGGMIIDSGTTITYLPDEAHRLVKQAIESQVKLPKVDLTKTGLPFDLCYISPFRSSPPQMPTITFHFDGADMELPAWSYVIPQTPALWCLAISGTNGTAIFGNLAQQNTHILYDLENEVLSFEPAQCNKL